MSSNLEVSEGLELHRDRGCALVPDVVHRQPQLPAHARTSYLTQCIGQMVAESQLRHEIVNLLFTMTDYNNAVTILWGIDSLKKFT